MKPVNEKSLTTKQRNKLDDSKFGLPDERKYPLTDKAHVRKAVQFFKYCPPAKRLPLASAINKRAKELKMNIQVSKDSAFYKYAAKTPVKESSLEGLGIELIEDTQYVFDSIDTDIRSFEEYFQVLISNMFHQEFNTTSIMGLDNFEERMFDIVNRNFGALDDSGFNPLSRLNDMAKCFYEVLLDLIEYHREIKLDSTRIMNCMLEDLRKLLNDCVGIIDVQTIRRTLKLITDLVEKGSINKRYLCRVITEVKYSSLLRKRFVYQYCEDEDSAEKIRNLCTIHDILDDYIADWDMRKDWNITCVIHPDDESFKNFLGLPSTGVSNTQYMFKAVKKKLEDELGIIDKSYEGRLPITHIFNTALHGDESEADVPVIQNILKSLEGYLRRENIQWFDECLCTRLSAPDLMFLKTIKEIDQIVTGNASDQEPVYYGLGCGDSLFLLARNRHVRGEYYLIKLFCNGEFMQFDNLRCGPDSFDPNQKLQSIQIKATRPSTLHSLTEGFHFDGEGNLKFTFKPRRSLMDEYAENHKLLVANFKSGNFDGMKTNLAYHFTLINYIEREFMFGKKGKKVSEEKKNEAMKARMFAMNDFKTYMSEVLKSDPSFDFAVYYEKGDFGKKIVSVSEDDIKGIKRLFHLIMIS